MGRVMATMNGRLSAKTSPITAQGRPLPTSDAEFLRDLAQQHEAGQRREREEEGGRQLAEEVPTEQAHVG